MLNLNHISFEASKKLSELDETFIGTDNYMGIAYFWAYEYRHYLRDIQPWLRRKIHKAFLKNNLKVDDVSDKHQEALNKYHKLFQKYNKVWK
jgi:hypothetical protein